MKLKYVVKKVEEQFGGIKLELRQKLTVPKIEEIEEMPKVEPVFDPLEKIKPETDEERVVVKILKAFRKFGLIPKPQPQPPALVLPVPIVKTTLYLSDEEYLKIGRPGVGEELELEITTRFGGE